MSKGSALALVLLVGCGASPSPSPSPSPAPARSTGEETFECRIDRMHLLDAMIASRRDHACTDASECRVITSPSHPDPEYAQVVFGQDADTLDASARDHLARCGAFHHHEAIDAYRAIEAGCDEGHCVAHETTFHVDE